MNIKIIAFLLLGAGLFSCQKENFETSVLDGDALAIEETADAKLPEAEHLLQPVSLDYLPVHDMYVLTAIDNNDNTSIFYGDKNNWAKVPMKYAGGAVWGDGKVLDIAFDPTSGEGEYAYMLNGYVVTNHSYWFSGRPRLFSGKKYHGPKGDRLIELLDLDYLPTAGYWVITGRSESGDIDTYFGTKKAWTKLNDNRDGNAAWGEFLASAWTQDNGLYIGSVPQNITQVLTDHTVKANGFYGVYAYLTDGKVAVNGTREFSGKPYFDTGKKLVGEAGDYLTSVLALEYIGYGLFSISGRSESGDIDTYLLWKPANGKFEFKKSPNKYDAGNAFAETDAYQVAFNVIGEDFTFLFTRIKNGMVAVERGYAFDDRGEGRLHARHNKGASVVR